MRKHFPPFMVTGRNNFGESEVMWFKMLESISKVYSFMLVAFFLVRISMQTESCPSSQINPVCALQEGVIKFCLGRHQKTGGI